MGWGKTKIAYIMAKDITPKDVLSLIAKHLIPEASEMSYNVDVSDLRKIPNHIKSKLIFPQQPKTHK